MPVRPVSSNTNPMMDRGKRTELMSTKRTHTDIQPTTGDERVFVVGGGHVGHTIATRLAGDGLEVHVLDRSIPADIPVEVTADEVLSLDGEALAVAEADRASAVVVAGRDDAENLLLTQLARTRFDVERIVTVVNDPRRISAFEPLNVEIVDAAAVLGHAVTERW